MFIAPFCSRPCYLIQMDHNSVIHLFILQFLSFTMKKITLLFLSTILLSFASCSVTEHSEEFNTLPKTAQGFINEFFPARYCIDVTVETENNSVVYYAKLTDRTKIKFDNLGLWSLVEMNNKQLPENFAPSKIFSYISTNYGSNYGERIERVGSNYEVKLKNNVILIFDFLGGYAGKR